MARFVGGRANDFLLLWLLKALSRFILWAVVTLMTTSTSMTTALILEVDRFEKNRFLCPFAFNFKCLHSMSFGIPKNNNFFDRRACQRGPWYYLYYTYIEIYFLGFLFTLLNGFISSPIRIFALHFEGNYFPFGKCHLLISIDCHRRSHYYY